MRQFVALAHIGAVAILAPAFFFTRESPMNFQRLAACMALSLSAVCASAHENPRADSHAPIGVMGDHVHKQGEWMISLRHMQMSMSGNLLDGNSITNDSIATTIPNRFAGMPGMPPTLRIVPQDMTTDMKMLGAMYAPSDKLTLMLMAMHLNKEMTLLTYQGGMGTNTLGRFQTESSGWGDTKIAALFSLLNEAEHKVHVSAGLSLPTGSTDESDDILTPMGMRPTVRLPYAMQLGSGTYDVLGGITYTGFFDRASWGSQAQLTLRQGENDEGYTLGDETKLNAWAQYKAAAGLSLSLRAEYKDVGEIDGQDSAIMGPVQTADPSNSGGSVLNLGLGMNVLAVNGPLRGHRLAFEYITPIQQDPNGLQMEMDNMWMLGYQYAF